MEITLTNQAYYEFNDLKVAKRKGTVSGPATIIRKQGTYTLVSLYGDIYMVK